MTTYSLVIQDQVYVYVRGQLVMKRWLKHGTDAIFHTIPGLTRWSCEGKTDVPWLGTVVIDEGEGLGGKGSAGPRYFGLCHV